MRVLFIKDVPGVAKCDDVREVKEGYALNFLLPHKLATPATAERIAAAKARAAAATAAGAKAQARAEAWATQLKGKSVTVSGRASAQGTLYAAVSAEALAKAIREQLGVPVEPEQVDMPQHLKSVGEHQVKVNIGSVSCAVSVTIKPA